MRLMTMMQNVAKTVIPSVVGRSKASRLLEQRPPEPGQPVDRLGEDRAAERQADVHAEHRHDRQHRVAQHVRAHHLRSGAPFARAVRT